MGVLLGKRRYIDYVSNKCEENKAENCTKQCDDQKRCKNFYGVIPTFLTINDFTTVYSGQENDINFFLFFFKFCSEILSKKSKNYIYYANLSISFFL